MPKETDKVVDKMQRKRKNSGFTMAELLIVVAIIAVLAGVSFIAVQSHQRSLAQLERNSIAKEIFFAAQNHLSMAESQGYLGIEKSAYGTISTFKDEESGEDDNNHDVYYITNGGSAPQSGSMLDLMLPFGAIEETVRSGGSYLIRYQAHPAMVLDVFYCSTSGRPSSYNYTIGNSEDEEDEYTTFLGYRDNLPGSGYVVGWYGGGTPEATGIYLEAPTIEIENGNKLIVTVTDPNASKRIDPENEESQTINAALELIISGETVDGKTAKAVILLNDPTQLTFDRNPRVTQIVNGGEYSYTVVLDDITTAYDGFTDGGHFADLNNYANGPADPNIWFMKDPVTNTASLFRPGENITVEAVSFSNEVLTNIAYSSAKMANSLFADNIPETENDGSDEDSLDEIGVGTPDNTEPAIEHTASEVLIANIRHLENLDPAISEFAYDDENLVGEEPAITATQTADLLWFGSDGNSFADSTTRVYKIKDEYGTPEKCYYPVNPSYPLIYNGNAHSISGIAVDTSASEGDTSASEGDTSASEGDTSASKGVPAGLFGAPKDGSDPVALTVSHLTLIDFNITGSGDAGALAGKLGAGSSVSNVLAYNSEGYTEPTNITSTGGSAGGLIGSMAGASSDARVSVVDSAAALYVRADSASAGGLIGAASYAVVSGSYSGGHTNEGAYASDSINVIGDANAGGLIGYASGETSVEACYSTCSADATVAGGLIGATDADSEDVAVAVSWSYAIGPATTTSKDDDGVSGDDGGVSGTFLGSGKLSGQTAEDLRFVYTVDVDCDDMLLPETAEEGEMSRADAKPYDTALKDQYKDKYIYPTIEQLRALQKGGAPAGDGDDDPVSDPVDEPAEGGDGEPRKNELHLSCHYGDWQEIKLIADTDLLLINAERLSAKVSFPADQLGEGRKLTLLIRGETSAKDENLVGEAYLVINIAPSEGVFAPSLTLASTVIEPKDSDKRTPEALEAWRESAAVTFAVDEKTGMATLQLNLDDITKPNGHFAQLFTEFVPGENLSVAARGGLKTQGKLGEALSEALNPEDYVLKSTYTVSTVNDSGETTEETYTFAARTNSLFADPAYKDEKGIAVEGSDMETSDAATAIANLRAAIANIRHLENLDGAISGVNEKGAALQVASAKQIKDLSVIPASDDNPEEEDLSWPGFIAAIAGDAGEASGEEGEASGEEGEASGDGPVMRVYTLSGSAAAANKFLPVSPAYALNYDGQGHSITGIVANTADDRAADGKAKAAGLFGEPANDSTAVKLDVSNLALIDFSITGSGDAGALAGKLGAGSTVSNVIAYNTTEFDADPAAMITSTGGNAGGLIGSMTGASSAAKVSVTDSAAALYVRADSASAGGLIGAASNAVVSGSYSGGHTKEGAYTTNLEGTASDDPVHINVIGGAYAGGLIGDADETNIDYSYSTCSAAGATAGGLAGKADGELKYCYATGLVLGLGTSAKEGALVGDADDAEFTYCRYFDIINERVTDDAVTYLPPLGNNADTPSGITALDDTAETYNGFVGKEDYWTQAAPYDVPTLTNYYGKYPLPNVERLGATLKSDGDDKTAYFVVAHYGDWPAPEIFVVNKAS